VDAGSDQLDDFVTDRMRADHIPGVSACILKSGRIAWSKGYGWANIARRIPMSAEHTIQNIGSISKTVTGTAVMQLEERGLLGLDDDVNRFLPFTVRHPSAPDTPITVRMLLTHQSGIADGPAYGETYACGDPKVALGDWLDDYLAPDGRHYGAATSFQQSKPGEQWHYSNVGFGLLGYLVERLTGQSLAAYSRARILLPLGMDRSGWFLSEIDQSHHAIPYAPADQEESSKEIGEYRKYGLVSSGPERNELGAEYHPLCLYSFATYPDGGFRTSVNQLARFVLAYVNQGAAGGGRVLAPETVRRMLTRQLAPAPDSEQGLVWRAVHVGSEVRWGHNGADPGVRTNMWFRPADGVGVIVFVNRGGSDLSPIANRLAEHARTL
jgi:CubicO group peptidase (beta-lactamase class C family)